MHIKNLKSNLNFFKKILKQIIILIITQNCSINQVII